MEKKFEEEIPKILKQIGYPYPISKSAMFAIGNMHSWPNLLGALQWMVEVIRVSAGLNCHENFSFYCL